MEIKWQFRFLFALFPEMCWYHNYELCRRVCVRASLTVNLNKNNSRKKRNLNLAIKCRNYSFICACVSVWSSILNNYKQFFPPYDGRFSVIKGEKKCLFNRSKSNNDGFVNWSNIFLECHSSIEKRLWKKENIKTAKRVSRNTNQRGAHVLSERFDLIWLNLNLSNVWWPLHCK